MTIVCMMVAMAVFASRVQADYHVSRFDFYGYSTEVGAVQDFVGCPSNYYKCKCYHDSDRAGFISQDPPSLSNFFTIQNLCGYKQLNHYANNDGTYSAFVNGGDGTVVAKCYGADTGKRTLHCTSWDGVGDVYDYLICYGHPCQP